MSCTGNDESAMDNLIEGGLHEMEMFIEKENIQHKQDIKISIENRIAELRRLKREYGSHFADYSYIDLINLRIKQLRGMK